MFFWAFTQPAGPANTAAGFIRLFLRGFPGSHRNNAQRLIPEASFADQASNRPKEQSL
jgi:hypothetical protein